jgi:voltage-gated potassium channel
LANELAQRRDEIEQQFREFLVDGDFDLVQNQTMVEKIRRELGLDKEQAQDIVLQVLREQALEEREKQVRQKNFCPHCGEALE